MSIPSIEITTKIGCPINCKFCAQNKLIHEYSKYSTEYIMSFEIFKQCLDKIPKNVRIDFAGFSEPFANPECIDMICYAHQQEYKQSLYSTLVGLDINDIEKLKKIHFSNICLHIADNEGNSHFIVDEKYINVLKEFVKNISCGYHCHGTVHNSIRHIIGETVARSVDINQSSLNSKAGSVDSISYDYKYGKIICDSCEFEFNKNVLLPNGFIVLCCMDYKMEWILGNLLKQDYNKLYNNEMIDNLVFKCNNNCEDFICRKCVVSKNIK